MVNSKAKGSAFERTVCAALSLWVTDGADKDCFWRSSMSGGRATIIRGKGGRNRQAGDICSVSPEGHSLTDRFFIECKHVKDLRFDQFCLHGKGDLAAFWLKAKAQAAEQDRVPMIIAKQNRYPELVLTPTYRVSNGPLFGHFVGLKHWGRPILIIPHLKCEIRLFDNMLKHAYAGTTLTVYEVTRPKIEKPTR